jgi:hypothetical protein
LPSLRLKSIEELTPGDIGYGDYSFEIGVTANSDGGIFCQNNDDSEVIDWKIELVFLKFIHNFLYYKLILLTF